MPAKAGIQRLKSQDPAKYMLEWRLGGTAVGQSLFTLEERMAAAESRKSPNNFGRQSLYIRSHG